MGDIDIPLSDYIAKKKIGVLNRGNAAKNNQRQPIRNFVPKPNLKLSLATRMKPAPQVMGDVRDKLNLKKRNITDARETLKKVDARSRIQGGAAEKGVTDMREKLNGKRTAHQAKKPQPLQLTSASRARKAFIEREASNIVRTIRRPAPIKKSALKTSSNVRLQSQPNRTIVNRSSGALPVQRTLNQTRRRAVPAPRTIVVRQPVQQIVYEDPQEEYYEDAIDDGMMMDGGMEDQLEDVYEQIYAAPQQVYVRPQQQYVQAAPTSKRVMNHQTIQPLMQQRPRQYVQQQPFMQQQNYVEPMSMQQSQYIQEPMNGNQYMGQQQNYQPQRQNYQPQRQQMQPQRQQMQQQMFASQQRGPMFDQNVYQQSNNNGFSHQQYQAPQRNNFQSQRSSNNLRSQQSSRVVSSAPSRAVNRNQNTKPAPVRKTPTGHRVSVSNLDPDVATARDIEELFENIGPITSAKMINKGTVHVIFEKLADAKQSVEIYHDRRLDGRAMQLKIIGAVYN